MHILMLREVIRECKRRSDEADCAAPNAFSKEQLEEAVLELFAIAKRPPMKLAISDEWLREKIRSGPDVEPSAGGAAPAVAAKPEAARFRGECEGEGCTWCAGRGVLPAGTPPGEGR